MICHEAETTSMRQEKQVECIAIELEPNLADTLCVELPKVGFHEPRLPLLEAALRDHSLQQVGSLSSVESRNIKHVAARPHLKPQTPTTKHFVGGVRATSSTSIESGTRHPDLDVTLREPERLVVELDPDPGGPPGRRRAVPQHREQQASAARPQVENPRGLSP